MSKNGVLKPTGFKKEKKLKKPTPAAMYPLGGGITRGSSSLAKGSKGGGQQAQVTYSSGKKDEDKKKKKKRVYAGGGELQSKIQKNLKLLKPLKKTEEALKKFSFKNTADGIEGEDVGEVISKVFSDENKKKRQDKRKERKEKKRYGGSVSYNSSSVRGYSKMYGGMGGEDE